MKEHPKSRKINLLYLLILPLCGIKIGFAAVPLLRGPIIEVLNCNESSITNSSVCQGTNDYYYISDSKIYHMDASGQSELFNTDRQYACVACDEEHVFASADRMIYQFDLQGNAIQMTDTEPYPDPDLLFAADGIVLFSAGGINFVLDADTLKAVPLKELFPHDESVGDYHILQGEDYRLIKLNALYDGKINRFVGSIQIDNKTVNNGSSSKGIILDEGFVYTLTPDGYVICDFHDTIIRKFPSQPDFRHISIDPETHEITAFYSDYSRNDLFNILFGSSNVKYRGKSFGKLTGSNLMYHSCDVLIQYNAEEDLSFEFRTKPGEIILHVTSEMAVTYYKGHYYFYDLSDTSSTELGDSQIGSRGTYTVVSCGSYLFVFDENGTLADRIQIK